MSLGAYFSSQGVPFAQAVGGVGPLTSYHDGSLGALEATATRVRDGALVETWDSRPVLNNGNAQMVTVEEATSVGLRRAECLESCNQQVIQPLQQLQVKVGPNSAWHDGIFQAEEDGLFGELQAYQSGSLGNNTGMGMPLYIDGREVNRPITIHHGPINGCGVCGCGGCDSMSGVDLSAYSNYFLYGGLALLGLGAYFMMKR